VEHPLLTLFSPQFLTQGQQVYAQLRAGGYTELVVYLAQQIQQFQQRGEEFAMKHLGSEDEMQQALLDIVASLPPEIRLEGLSPEERLRGLTPEEMLRGLTPDARKEMLRGLTPEEMLRGLTPHALERLRQLLQSQTKEGDSSNPK
jgi:hypothetical protein